MSSPHPYSDTAACTATSQIHGGAAADTGLRPVTPPVHLSAAYEFATLRDAREAFAQREAGFTYSRTGSPTVALLERRVAELEAGTGGVATASGQAAIALTLLALAGSAGQSPDGRAYPQTPAGHVVASAKIYGGTADLLNDSLADAGISVTWVDPHSPEEWAQAITEQTRALLVESIGNPHADLPDIAALADVAHRNGLPLLVDNTLASPYLLQPAKLGADFVIHSATKYLSGNGTALAGVVVDTGRFDPTAEPEKWPQFTAPTPRFGNTPLVERYGAGAVLHLIRAKYLHDLGPCLAPMSAQQVLEGIETLDVRVEKHCRNAEALAERLLTHPAVDRVRHPSVPGDPNAEAARKHFPRGTGAVLSFEVTGDYRDVERFINALQLFKLAANIGDSRSMVAHPASMTHCRLSPELREAGEITEQTVRLSVGRENPEDLWADIQQAFTAAGLGKNDDAAATVSQEATV
ncbi:O-acetylhomoserine aminocarboxypropyltransferase/cysteine synthase [Nesterenkonia sp. MY13]|uniref:homocysteine desulfhydrase n=1 Tax=Nesterenkonia sedimenti TaxID=1463632 RepID=A0A7X8TLF3_9MICC|nr:PLP-dependent transferase [Nesterenkonia sedimenti]NLS10755.1 O-acetylhomoserine aminocarboxypropyltransferase/cysteine synthase [Nesterenkonia sedimenti]